MSQDQVPIATPIPSAEEQRSVQVPTARSPRRRAAGLRGGGARSQASAGGPGGIGGQAGVGGQTNVGRQEGGEFQSWWQRRQAARREARRVRRIIYGFELWSVLKVSLLFYLCAWGVFLLTGVALWRVANSQGYVERFENFILEVFNYETFTINGDELFRWFLWFGLVGVLMMTALTVVMCLLYNFISVLLGGIRVTLIEEETVRFREPSG